LLPWRAQPGPPVAVTLKGYLYDDLGEYDDLMRQQTLLRLIAWCLFAGIVFATLGPIDVRPRTTLSIDLERMGAYLVLGLSFSIAYPRHIWWAIAIVVVGAIGLELMQELRPGRHGRETDAIVKIAGAAIGLGLGWVVVQLAKRNSGATASRPRS
jgi:VanZ family protein